MYSDDMKQILSMRERELDRIYEMNYQLIEMVRELEQGKDYWKTRFYEIQNSTCWRMTKGFRVLARWIHRR